MKLGRISGLAGELLASQEGLLSIELTCLRVRLRVCALVNFLRGWNVGPETGWGSHLLDSGDKAAGA